MNVPESSYEFFWTSPAAFVLLVVVAIIVLGVMKMRRPSTINATLTAMAEEREREAGVAKCPCGEVATEPLPTIKRGRGGIAWLRDFFGMPPMWTREIDRFKPNLVCRSHAHVADEMCNQALLDTRAKYAALNVEASTFLAGFEQEGLYAKIASSLTEKQKKDQARARAAAAPSPLRAVSSIRTGTDDETSSS